MKPPAAKAPPALPAAEALPVWRQPLFQALAILAMVLLAFSHGFAGVYTRDDDAYLVSNALLREPGGSGRSIPCRLKASPGWSSEKTSSAACSAMNCYRESLRSFPGHAKALVGLGNCALATGEPVQAREHDKKALATNPRETGAMLGLAQIALAAGRLDEARSLIEQAWQIVSLLDEHLKSGLAQESGR